MKYCLLLCLFACTTNTGHANIIDSLTTKEAVKKFIIASFSKRGIIFLNGYANITQGPLIPVYLSIPDTTMVEDPITRAIAKMPMPRDSSYLSRSDTDSHPFDVGLDEIEIWRINRRFNNFYKMDIDGNGYTDLVADAGFIIIAMDMGNRIEGHMFTNNADILRFLGPITLPDRSTGLLLRHDHDLCPPLGQLAMETRYITDTIVDETTVPAVRKIDTIYSESSYPRSGPQCLKTDTIVYKFGGYAKYNRRFKPVGISKIAYYDQYYPAYSWKPENTCIEIRRNGQCFLHYMQYDTTFSAMLDNKRLDALWNLTLYIDVKSKRNVYFQTDPLATITASAPTFAIYFDDGTVKKINIRSYYPLLDLSYFSKNLSEISRELQWQPAKKPPDFECPYVLPQSDAPPVDCECAW